ncbi:MAG TPA: HEPN domain-containing protein [Solirubrobacterales bacterium]|nr:HEPN domain-containing protein [Solirubrobacterales bacterium]
MAPKPKVEVAREHLSKAQEEAAAGDLKDAVQWSFASLEAAIDALAAKHGIVIEEQHWRRRDAAHELMLKGVLPRDLSDLHQLLNEERKAMFYEGEEPELGDLSIENILSEVEVAVKVAEADEG